MSFPRPPNWFLALLRYSGLLIALMSVLVVVMLSIDAFRAGYVLVNGEPRTEGAWKFVLVPLPMGLVGAAMFLLIPKQSSRKKDKPE
jgi:hypothetical protein